ncbi:MAG: tripartite tricarboxylate transporter TctB family protein [Hyphomicrobiaceae bacterium]
MPKSDLIAGVALTVFGVVTLFILIPTQTSSGGDATISPALLPQICAIGITGLAILLTLRAAGRLRRGLAAGQIVPATEWLSSLAVIIAVAAGIALFKFVNPGLAAGFMIISLMLYMGERRLWFLIGIPAVLLIGSWFLFYRILGTAIA